MGESERGGRRGMGRKLDNKIREERKGAEGTDRIGSYRIGKDTIGRMEKDKEATEGKGMEWDEERRGKERIR